MPLLAALPLLVPVALGQQPAAGEILRDLEHLRVVGSVLYVAAHPDDENTRLLAWLRAQGLRATYLSLTRGGGGQNLIGPEQNELLGVMRTGELLAARAIDGAEQRFTRARDFGYSKSPEESLELWGHEVALDDVVRAIRELRPDVIVTRFDPHGQSHGHHTASAILAGEAFRAAADPARFPDQGLPPWQADRLLYNRSTWGSEAVDTSGWLQLDVGGFDPLTGTSAGEVAARSRTQHKTQGFGSAPSVGPLIEYFTVTDGTPLEPGRSPLAGLDLGWTRFPGTRALERALAQAAERFEPARPAAALPLLARAHALLAEVPDPTWRATKTAEVERLMAACAGLWLTARSDTPAVVPGGQLKVQLTALSRGAGGTSLERVAPAYGDPVPGGPLAVGVPWKQEITVSVPPDAPVTLPHWLAEPMSLGSYTIPDGSLRNAPDTSASLTVDFELTIAGRRLVLRQPVEHAWTDRVEGERRHPVEILPPATATFAQDGIVVPIGGRVTTRVTVHAPAGAATGVLQLTAPQGIAVSPSEVPFALTEAAPELTVDLVVSAGAGAPAGPLVATAVVDGRSWSRQRAVIDHPHLPRRTVLAPATLRVAPVALERGPARAIGHLPGSGDLVAESLRLVGYQVETIDDAAVLGGGLDRFDTVVVGIRAYNTNPRLLAVHEQLMAWVARGGRLVVQYNTNGRWDTFSRSLGPYPFEIGRGRVTDERAEMRAVDPAHPALTTPNALGPADFEGWVQERGLYFAESFDPRFQPIFSTQDPGEEPQLGSTLVARHGEGVYVYTGLAFFRQLPAGVPGAYRLFANLLSL